MIAIVFYPVLNVVRKEHGNTPLCDAEVRHGSVEATLAVPANGVVVLPVSVSSDGILDMIDPGDALAKNFVYAYDWFRKAGGVWKSKRKTESHNASAWLNYDNKIANQKFRAPWIVLFNRSGTNISASLLARKETLFE